VIENGEREKKKQKGMEKDFSYNVVFFLSPREAKAI
jgi:hypothetical protein